MGRKLSQVGIDFIHSFESCRLTAYKPVAEEQYFTIGWGHYGKDVYYGMKITQEKADKMFLVDIAESEVYVNSKVYVPLTDKLNQNQFDVLVSFAYNCGQGNLQKLCKNRTIGEISEALLLYKNGANGVLNGLIRRRKAEQELFNKSVQEVKEIAKTTMIINGVLNDGIVQIEGSNYVSAQALKLLGIIVEWDNKNKVLKLDNK